VKAATPNKAVELGRLAVTQAQRLGHQPLAAEALAELGNAHRRQGDLRAAGGALKAARRLSLVVGLDPLAEARLHTLLASWRNQCRDHQRALGHARRALRLYREVEQEREALITSIKLAYLLTEAGAPERALPVSREAWVEATRSGDPRLALLALHNRIYALVEMEHYDAAQQLLAEGSPLYRQAASAREHTLASWLQARCHCGTGAVVRGTEILETVCAELADMELGYEYVIAGLHLGLAYLAANRAVETRRLCSDLLPLAETLGVDDAAIGALRLALEADALTAATLRSFLAAVDRTPRGSAA
jgi:tetratricopeptide (TPR) repeat protein